MKRRFLIRLITGLLTLLPALPADGQTVPRTRDFRPICDSLSARLKRRMQVDFPLSVSRVTRSGSSLNLTFSANLSYYPWHADDLDWFRGQLQELWAFSGFKPGRILTNGYELSELETPVLRADGQPAAFSGRVPDPRQTQPRFIETLGARRFPKGMDDRYIVLWQSHGRYYDEEQDRWTWQRAGLHRTVEDMFTPTFVLPFLIPMLENAGAYVMTPRERDTQRLEIITDNDPSFEGPREALMRRKGSYAETGSWTDAGEGFADTLAAYTFEDFPWRSGTARQVGCSGQEADARASWTPHFAQRGSYAVYISYKSLPNSCEAAHYTVHHLGGQTEFLVNQRRGGGTWIYLGTFEFAAGDEGRVVLDNRGPEGAVVTADAVKLGGGMGKINRGGRVSGMAASAEGAHYWMHWAGADTTVTRSMETDYTNDYAARGAWTVMMRQEKNIPVDLALAFHTDAGLTPNDSIVGTMTIYTLNNEGSRKFDDGRDRLISRVLCDYVQTQIVQDIRKDFEPEWTRRGLMDRSYNETRTSGVPTMILELLSHQNLADMKYGLDPAFRFTVARAVYKGLLKTLSDFYGSPYVVQPLPVQAFAARLDPDAGKVRLSWAPAPDPKEPTAEAEGYTVYTRIDNGAFDQGVETREPALEVPVEPGHVYSFRVVAWNEGGRSFPSEILSAGLPVRDRKPQTVLIVNNFDRISAPAWTDSTGHAGFEGWRDSGVPYLQEIGYIGENYEFKREAPFVDNDNPGFGASRTDRAGEIIAGNRFDYPYRHGTILIRLGYPFCSMSRDAFCTAPEAYPVVDLICGKQGRTPTGRGAMPDRFEVYPEALTEALRRHSDRGGNLLVSGACIASDPPEDSPAASLVREVLGCSAGNRPGTGGDLVEDMPFSHEMNEDVYSVEWTDGLKPEGRGSRIWLRYPDTGDGAAVYNQGDGFRTVTIGVPVETLLRAADREWVLSSAMEYLSGGKKPSARDSVPNHTRR